MWLPVTALPQPKLGAFEIKFSGGGARVYPWQSQIHTLFRKKSGFPRCKPRPSRGYRWAGPFSFKWGPLHPPFGVLHNYGHLGAIRSFSPASIFHGENPRLAVAQLSSAIAQLHPSCRASLHPLFFHIPKCFPTPPPFLWGPFVVPAATWGWRNVPRRQRESKTVPKRQAGGYRRHGCPTIRGEG